MNLFIEPFFSDDSKANASQSRIDVTSSRTAHSSKIYEGHDSYINSLSHREEEQYGLRHTLQ
jgi:hypothetical protein